MVTFSYGASSNDLKIVFTGPMGSGKTTAIRAICEGDVLSTEVPMSGEAMGDKTETTVGMDYGECELGEDQKLKLFGTPGQARFSFMWEILGAGAFGLVVLVDNTTEDPIGDVEMYLESFGEHVRERRTVIGVGRVSPGVGPSIDDYCQRLAARGWKPPVIEVDVRREDDVRLLLSVLVSMAEVEEEYD